jgi:hypothetical protein
MLENPRFLRFTKLGNFFAFYRMRFTKQLI